MEFKKLPLAWVAILVCIQAVAAPPVQTSEIKLDSVSPEYTPTAGPELPEPVSVAEFNFEVNRETGRARVVVEYSYPDEAALGSEGGVGPQPTKIQVAGMKYDAATNQVIYEANGRRTVCATAADGKFLFWKTFSVTPTGACVVASRPGLHVEDDGWSLHRVRSVDTYLELR